MRTQILTTEDQWRKTESEKREKVYVTYEHVHRLIEKSVLLLREFQPDVIVLFLKFSSTCLYGAVFVNLRTTIPLL